MWLHIILCCLSFTCAGRGETVQRILDILRFLGAIVLAMVDGLTQWLNLLTKQYREISTVLCNERYFIIQKIQQVNTTECAVCTSKCTCTHAHTRIVHMHACTYKHIETNTNYSLCDSGDSADQQQTPEMIRNLRAVKAAPWRRVWTTPMQKILQGTGLQGHRCFLWIWFDVAFIPLGVVGSGVSFQVVLCMNIVSQEHLKELLQFWHTFLFWLGDKMNRSRLSKVKVIMTSKTTIFTHNKCIIQGRNSS